MNMSKSEIAILKEKAVQAAKNAHAPYSHFSVGAALESEDGTIYIGCNVESSSYGLTVCAERNAIASAIVDGQKKFKAMAVYSLNAATPCGACRQVIWDICKDIPIYLFDNQGNDKQINASDLLPYPFDDKMLEGI